MPFPVGIRHRFALTLLGRALAALALAASIPAPADAQDVWVKDPFVQVRPDSYWGPDSWTKGGPRLVLDGKGDLYLNLSDSLLVRERGSATWRCILRGYPANRYGTPALAVSRGGIALWDRGLSRDQGRTWESLGAVDSGDRYPTAMGILDDGSLLAGGMYARLDRSADTGRSWGQVHVGNTFGNISAILPGDRDWAFAAAEWDNLVATRDGGKTWSEAVGLARGKAPERIEAKYMACNPDSHILFALTDPATSDPVLEEIRWVGDSLLITTHLATRTFPDSQISAFAMPTNTYFTPLLLVGTWGQGVWASPDWGKSWRPRNEGLGDLRIEAMVIEPNGTLHALTPGGLYTSSPASALAQGPQRRQAMRRSRPAGPGILFGKGSEVPDPSESLFRADGRLAFPGFRSRL
jgi:hypothetical protein